MWKPLFSAFTVEFLHPKYWNVVCHNIHSEHTNNVKLLDFNPTVQYIDFKPRYFSTIPGHFINFRTSDLDGSCILHEKNFIFVIDGILIIIFVGRAGWDWRVNPCLKKRNHSWRFSNLALSLGFSRVRLRNRQYPFKSPLYRFSRALEWYKCFWVLSDFRQISGLKGFCLWRQSFVHRKICRT